MKKLLVLMAALVLLMTIAPALAQSNTLVMGIAADATGLDPQTQTAFASFRLLELIYEPLVTVDPDLNIVPALAESWEFTNDSTTLTMHLRQGVKFHDGSDFTSADVKASFERILNEETAAAGRASYLSIDTMDTPDDATIIFNLKESDVPILGAMTSLNSAIVSSEMAEGGDFASQAIGTGPFVLGERTPDESTTLSANADWWGDGPFVDGVEIRIIPDEASIVAALRAGEIDFALLNDPLIAMLLVDDATVTLNRVPAIAYHVLQLNATRAPMDKLEVRQAISCAIDRQEVLDTASLGEGQVTPPLTIPAYRIPTDDLFCYQKDVAKAKEFMAAAGVEGFTLKMIAANAEPPTALSEAQSIQAQLAEIGITVEIESLELSVYVDRWLAADFDSAVASNGGRPDPYTMYVRYWTKTGNLAKVAAYGDDTLDSLMAQGRAESDPAKRFEIFTEFQQHVVEMAPWVWLYNGYEYTAQQPYVEGFQPNPTDSLYSFGHVKLNR